jgi:hypothetical protein
MITKEKVRAKRNATPFVPFVIHTSKGDAVRVPAPGFILSASDTPLVIVQEQNGRLHYINVELITSLEEEPVAPSQSSY